MKNFVQPGNTLTVPAPATVQSGDGVLIEDLFGVAAGNAGSGDPVDIVVAGVFDLPKVGSEAWDIGSRIYWTGSACTTADEDNTLIGIAVAAVGTGSTETIGRVRLNGAY